LFENIEHLVRFSAVRMSKNQSIDFIIFIMILLSYTGYILYLKLSCLFFVYYVNGAYMLMSFLNSILTLFVSLVSRTKEIRIDYQCHSFI